MKMYGGIRLEHLLFFTYRQTGGFTPSLSIGLINNLSFFDGFYSVAIMSIRILTIITIIGGENISS